MENDNNKEYSIDNEQLARFAKAMGHPARITILQFLASMDSCYFGDIHNELPIAKATVSQHLKELKSIGIIKGSIEGKSVCYCIDETTLQHLNDYIAQISERLSKRTTCC